MANKKLKCAECGNYFPREIMIKRFNKNFCCAEHFAANIARKAQADLEKKKAKRQREFKAEVSKARKEKARAARNERAARKEGIKTTSQLIAEAQNSFNLYIRMRDYFKPCPSCLTPADQIRAEQGWKTGGAFDAGHFRSRGAAGQLRFNLLNVWHQCKACNSSDKHNKAKGETVSKTYESTLRAWIGDARVDEIKNNRELENKDRDRLIRIKKIFAKRARFYRKLRQRQGAEI